jgi:predicted membrane protein
VPEISEIFDEIVIHAVFTGVLFAALYLLIAAGLLPTIFFQDGKRYLSRLSRLALFLGLLFAWGAVAGSIWWWALAPRWYVRADPIVEYVAILPFGEWAIDEMCGAYLLPGVTMQGLRLRWLLMSLPVWGLAWWCYRWIRSRREPHPAAWDLG